MNCWLAKPEVILLVGVIAALSLGARALYLEARYGALECGQVHTTTPTGEFAIVEKCWRTK